METKLLDQSMRHRSFHTGIFRALLIAFVAVQLMACGGGGGGSGASGTGTDSVAQSVVNPADSTGSGSSTNSATSSYSGDGTSTDSSATNNTNVTSTSNTSTLTLSWTAPVARSDGTPLSLADIDGYYIYFGNTPGNYTYHVNVADGTAQEAILKNLAVGTYYIVMTTYDIDGQESSYSSMVIKTAS